MDKNDVKKLLELPLGELILKANAVRAKSGKDRVELCGIMNAKSGMCGEDCKFCAQSGCHDTGVEVYGLKDKEEILSAARKAVADGARRFGIVTSGNRLSRDEIQVIAGAFLAIQKELDLKLCASLGELNKDEFDFLKKHGMSRYHHNIETSPSYFPKIVTTHTFQDRVNTIKAAKESGLQICSGGIIGIGENWDDRIEMALTLRDLGVDSVPVNIFVPIPGTSLSACEISPTDAIRTIAIFRIILKDKVIKLAAGRESMLKDFQAMAFTAGANGMLIGGYLTVKGRSAEEDRILVREIENIWNL